MQVTYNYFFVSLSIIISVFGSYVALDVGNRIQLAWGWLVAAATTLGLSIWSMHFVGMLAFDMDMSVTYDADQTIASLLIAIIMTGIGFATRKIIWIGGALMGLGIAGMHYLGMSAMRMAATVTYDPWIVATSIAIAVSASIAALWLYQRKMARIKSAAVMGIAIAGMHYTGMAATRFTPTAMIPLGNLEPFAMAVSIWLATMLILAITLAVSMYDRNLSD